MSDHDTSAALTSLDNPAAVSRRGLLAAGTALASMAAIGSVPSAATAAPAAQRTDGLIYAINSNKDLLWYRHRGRNNATFDWDPKSATRVGNGWNFQHVFYGN